jgi:glutamate 5-kinase
MTDLVRQEIMTTADPVVVKVGSRVLTRSDGAIDTARIGQLAEQLAHQVGNGRHVVLVSSGAVAAGLARLGLIRRPRDVAQLQAVAAVGQSHLVEVYDGALRRYGRHAAQVLLTADDLNDRTRYLNVRNTIRALFQFGAVPILNENDTVSVDELQISFGDNDRLAAMVANLIDAPLLVLLSDVDGLFDGDPADPNAQRVPIVTRLDESVFAMACDTATGVGKGGMASKLRAAHIATAAGGSVVIACGHTPRVVDQILAGETLGTLILAQGPTIASRKRWIGFAARPAGQLVLDEGACQAIERHGRSLLAIGIVGVVGNFRKGDIVVLKDQQGREFARGLTNYRAADIRQIGGLRTDQIADVLGHCPYREVVHRDNLLVPG